MLKTFLLRSETRHGCLFLQFLFIIILKILATAMKQGEEVVTKKEVNFLFQMTWLLNIENPQESAKQLWQ